MDWIIAISLFILLVWNLALHAKIDALKGRVASLDANSRPRQGRVNGTRASTPGPKTQVPRTTRRDSNDLPVTGRMSTALQRRRSHDRATNDDQLQ